MAERSEQRKTRNQIPDSDPIFLRHRPTISGVCVASDANTDGGAAGKKKNFTSSKFRGLGCTASSQVSVPEAIRTSANWESKKLKKKLLKPKKSGGNKLFCNNPSAAAAVTNGGGKNTNSLHQSPVPLALSSSCVSVPDVWCGPGIGLTADSTSVDCVVSRKPPSASARGKIDGVGKIGGGQRERSPFNPRRMVASEDITFFESDEPIGLHRFRADAYGSRNNRHSRRGFRDGFAEIIMLQGSLFMGGNPNGLDLYRGLRLDVDNMSYEELLELGDRIGHVSTGLREDEISHYLSCSKLAKMEIERKCSICQEEYEMEDEAGKMNCGHSFHIDCIKKWLMQKNICPICKTEAIIRI